MKKIILPLIQTLLLLVIAGGVVFNFSKDLNLKPSRPSIEYVREAEVKYISYLSDLTDEVQKYITTNAPSSNLRALNLIELCNEYDIDVKFVLAQAKVESNFGVAGLASKTNSVWNVGAFDGLDHNGISGRYKYSHPNESIEPYLKLLTTRYLVDKSEQSLMLEFVDVSGKRYASAPDYEQRLKKIYDDITTNTNIDELVMMLRHYKIEGGR